MTRRALAFVLLVFPTIQGAAAGKECLSCQYDSAVPPPRVLSEYRRALATLQEFEAADRALALQLSDRFVQLNSNPIFGFLRDTTIDRWVLPWLPRDSASANDGDIRPESGINPSSTNVSGKKPKVIGFELDVRATPGETRTTATIDGLDGTRAGGAPLVANWGQTSGRRYWEAKFHAGSAWLPRDVSVGVAAWRGGSISDFLWIAPGYVSQILMDGETLQFALDLDHHVIHIGVGGVWVVGDPRTPDSGEPIRSYARIAPAASIGEPKRFPYEPDALTFNFGDQPFQYPMPRGYSSFSGKATTGASPVPRSPMLSTARVESAFMSQLMEERIVDSELGGALEHLLQLRHAYRGAACHLVAKYRRLETTLDPQCARDFDEHLLRSLDTSRETLSWMQDEAPDQLPVIDPREHPRLHFAYANEWPYGSPLRLERIRVRVSDASAPLVLVLRSDHPTEWSLEVAPNVVVRHVLLMGEYRQTLLAPGNLGSVRSYSLEQGNAELVWKKLQLYELHPGPELTKELLFQAFHMYPSSIEFGCVTRECSFSSD